MATLSCFAGTCRSAWQLRWLHWKGSIAALELDRPAAGRSPAGLRQSSPSLCSLSLQKRQLSRYQLGLWQEPGLARTVLLGQTLQIGMQMQLVRLRLVSRMQTSGGLTGGVTCCSFLLFCHVHWPRPGWDAVAASRGVARSPRPAHSTAAACCAVLLSAVQPDSSSHLAAASSVWLPEQGVWSRPCVANSASCW